MFFLPLEKVKGFMLEKKSYGGVLMVRSLKFLVALVAVLIWGSFAVVQQSWSAVADTGPFTLCEGDPEACSTANVVYVSKQFLPASGFVATSQGFVDENSAYEYAHDGILKRIGDLQSDNDTKLRITAVLQNGTFEKSSIGVYVDNGTHYTFMKFNTVSSKKAVITLDNATVKLSGTIQRFVLVDGDAMPEVAAQAVVTRLPDANHVLSVAIDGGLNPGDRVTLSLTSEFYDPNTMAYNTFQNGCVNRDLYIVENQWIAHTCSCDCGTGKETIDSDLLYATNDGVSVKDAQTGAEGYSIYDACYATTPAGGTCCPKVEPSCGFFCQEETQGGIQVTCSMPGHCNCTLWNNRSGLTIFENYDFDHPSVSPYKITNLADSTVEFALTTTGKLENIEKVELLGWWDGATPADAAVLGTFNIDSQNGVAKLQISGDQLFRKVNGGVQTGNTHEPIHFSIKITPKSGILLQPQKFSLTAKITGGQLENEADLSWNDFLEWTYDTNAAFVFKVPYIRQDSLVTSVIRFENANTADVGVSLYVNTPNGDGWKFVKHITVEPGKAYVVSGSDLINWASDAGITLDGSKGFAVFGVSDADEQKFTVYASQQMTTNGSFRPLPVKVAEAAFSE